MDQTRKNRRWLFIVVLLAVVLITMLEVIWEEHQWRLAFESQNADTAAFADNNLSAYQYPEELVKLMRNNPETEEYVLNYPVKKDLQQEYSLEEYDEVDEVPLLMQWDERWGYEEYAGELMGLSGCGPTCLSMVCIYLLEDTTYDPSYIAAFSEENGFYDTGNGSKWTLISEGGELLGLDVVEIPLDEDRIIRNLEADNPIICVMGPGDFTSSGHFVVMTDYEDGKLTIHDPNSKKRSNQRWEYADIADQIQNLWVCRT